MKTRLIIPFLFLILGLVKQVSAQSSAQDIFHDEEGNTYHQLFLDFHVTEIVELKYATDNKPIEGVLSADGYSIIIKNYPGDRTVKLVYKDDVGQRKELTKGKCFIDPVILNL